MATAPPRPCPSPGCAARVPRGYCSVHRKQLDRGRLTSTARGYDVAWARFRKRFITELVAAGLLPVCGASLPDGPQGDASECRRLGVLTFASADGSSLHLDHAPELTDAERNAATRGDRDAFDHLLRVRLLCAECHRRRHNGTYLSGVGRLLGDEATRHTGPALPSRVARSTDGGSEEHS